MVACDVARLSVQPSRHTVSPVLLRRHVAPIDWVHNVLLGEPMTARTSRIYAVAMGIVAIACSTYTVAGANARGLIFRVPDVEVVYQVEYGDGGGRLAAKVRLTPVASPGVNDTAHTTVVGVKEMMVTCSDFVFKSQDSARNDRYGKICRKIGVFKYLATVDDSGRVYKSNISSQFEVLQRRGPDEAIGLHQIVIPLVVSTWKCIIPAYSVPGQLADRRDWSGFKCEKLASIAHRSETGCLFRPVVSRTDGGDVRQRIDVKEVLRKPEYGDEEEISKTTVCEILIGKDSKRVKSSSIVVTTAFGDAKRPESRKLAVFFRARIER